MLSLMTNDAEILCDFISRSLIGLIPQSVTFIGALSILFFINYRIGIACLITSILFIVLAKLIARNIRPVSKTLMEKYAVLVSTLEENLQLIEVVKSYSLENFRLRIFNTYNQDYFSTSKSFFFQKNLISPAVQLIGGILILTGIWVLSREIDNNSLTIPELVSVLLYGILLTRPMSQIAAIYGRLQTALAASERIQKLMNQQPELGQYSERDLEFKDQSIHLEKISFGYPDRLPSLVELDLKVKSGQTVSIIGDNGEGKSTIAKLILGFYSPTSGKIFVGKNDITKLNLRLLRQSVCYVQQNTLLFNDSLRNNIRLNNKNLTDKDIQEVLKISGGLDAANHLPDNLDTKVGDLGIMLSGGQQQKIALARALIRKPKFLILDEATSMFDPESENIFIENCQKYLASTTIVNITHRRASLKASDKIYKLQRGKLYPINTHP